MGLVNTLSKEFEITTEWHPLEIHPETPKAGVNLEDRFGKVNLTKALKNLRLRGKALGLDFGELIHMPNSKLAHQIGLLAMDHGVFDRVHQGLMDAYFRDSLDIGDKDILYDIATKNGLDGALVRDVLDNNTYSDRVDQLSKEAYSKGIASTPTFIINGEHIINGAQDIEVFRKILK